MTQTPEIPDDDLLAAEMVLGLSSDDDMIAARRRIATLADTDNEIAPLQVDNQGALYVNAAASEPNAISLTALCSGRNA